MFECSLFDGDDRLMLNTELVVVDFAGNAARDKTRLVRRDNKPTPSSMRHAMKNNPIWNLRLQGKYPMGGKTLIPASWQSHSPRPAIDVAWCGKCAHRFAAHAVDRSHGLSLTRIVTALERKKSGIFYVPIGHRSLRISSGTALRGSCGMIAASDDGVTMPISIRLYQGTRE
jgi:hypothetical protein